MSLLADSFAAGLERGLRGKGWRQEPYPGPLDLLLALMPDYVETPALRLISDELVAREEAAESEANPKYLAVSMGPQEGKALALDTPIATPTGWTTMGELKPGDQVFDRRGKPCNVVAVSQVWTDRPCFTVRTGDGEAIVADAAHEWLAVMNPKSGRTRTESVVETAGLARRRSKNPQILGPGDRRRDVWAEPTESVPTVCIEVDSYDHTFLAGRTLLPTHNSTLIAFAYPIWLWLRNPDLRILIISYDNETSWRWGRAIKEAIQNHAGDDPLFGVNLHLSLRPGSEAVARLQLDGHRGAISCMSLKSGIAGKPADRIVCDDLVKDRATARSGAYKRLWRDQWQSNIRVRLGPRAMVVIDHTRWASDDPIGQQLSENGSAWKYVNIPALVEAPKVPDGPGGTPNLGTPNKVRDPLGRQEGEWLISARGRTDEQWEKTRRDVGEADFAALYQGTPMPGAGGLFQRADVRFWQPTADPWTIHIPGRPGPDEDLRTAMRFVTVDLAASLRTSADWTVASAWAIAGTGELLMLDLNRDRVDPKEHWEKLVAPLQTKWQCPIYVENSQYSIDLVYGATRAGAVVNPLEADTDKYTRAVPAAKRMREGILFPPSAHWWPDFADEIFLFPGAAHDDQVDTLSYAHRVRTAIWTPAPPPPPPGRRQDPLDVQAFGGVVADIASAPL